MIHGAEIFVEGIKKFEKLRFEKMRLSFASANAKCPRGQSICLEYEKLKILKYYSYWEFFVAIKTVMRLI